MTDWSKSNDQAIALKGSTDLAIDLGYLITQLAPVI